MEIKLSQNIGAVTRLGSGPDRPRETKAPSDVAAFDRAEALNQAIRTAPDTRPDEIARARALVADSKYPPRETIQSIANLLAIHLEGTTE